MGYFPRSKERGLIEVMRDQQNLALLSHFPRSKERGLIEVSFNPIRWSVILAFRVRKSAASLKWLGEKPCRNSTNLFPRSKERGLIEVLQTSLY